MERKQIGGGGWVVKNNTKQYTFVCDCKLIPRLLSNSVAVGSERGHCNLRSPAFLEWDALTVFLESVMSRLKLADTPASVQQDGICLMKAVLAYNTNVHDIFSLRGRTYDDVSATMLIMFASYIYHMSFKVSKLTYLKHHYYNVCK